MIAPCLGFGIENVSPFSRPRKVKHPFSRPRTVGNERRLALSGPFTAESAGLLRIAVINEQVLSLISFLTLEAALTRKRRRKLCSTFDE